MNDRPLSHIEPKFNIIFIVEVDRQEWPYSF